MITVDLNEPSRIIELIEQSLPVTIEAANDAGLADYSYLDIHHAKVSHERKQADELLSTGLDEVETQLRRQLNNTDILELVIEGFLLPGPGGTYASKPRQSSKGAWVQQSYYHIPYSMVRSWLLGLREAGVDYTFTGSLEGTAQYLVAAYKFDQKAEHDTLRRYTRERNTWHPDRRVSTLLSIRGVGEQRAQVMLRKYQSIKGIIEALGRNQFEVGSLPGMDTPTASYMRLILESQVEVLGQ